MKKETDALINKESGRPIFVIKAEEIFLQLGKTYAKSVGKCPDTWKDSYPELKVTKKQIIEKQFIHTNIQKAPKLIPYKSEDEKIPEKGKLRELFLTLANEIKEIATHGDRMNEHTLVKKRDTSRLWIKKLSAALHEEKIERSSEKEWIKALNKADEFLEKCKDFSEEQLQSTTEIKNSCCQII